ncbi:MAG: hypothetical protein Q8S44_05140 [Flavobacteriaceae bacterium]|nr:hypothetical protein [Flavobacteriaceae bacterium]
MKTKNLILFSLILLLSLATIVELHAQEPAWWTQQKKDCHLTGSLVYYNNWVAAGSPCYSDSSPNSYSGGGINFKSPVVSGIVGSILFALGGSLIEGKNGEYQWQTGMAGGYFLFSSIPLMKKDQNKSLAAKLVLAGITGAAGGAAVAGFEKGNRDISLPPKPDNTIKDAAIGAAALITTSAVINLSRSKKGYSYRINKNSILSKSYVSVSSNKIRLLILL